MRTIRRAAPRLARSVRARDAAAALAVAIVQVGITALAARRQTDVRPLDAGGVALLVAASASLLVRRQRPGAALGIAFVATMTYALTDYPRGPVFLALIVTFVTAVIRGRRALAWATLGAGYVIAAWVTPLVTDDTWPNWAAAIALAAWLLLLGVGSELVGARLDRAAERAQAQAEEARRRVTDERLRIARELHDVLAHDISLINVRAGVALHLLDTAPDRVDPDQVRPALAAIKEASAEALGELRSVLDVLRRGDGDAAPLAPTAGLADLESLAERTRGTGLVVRVEWQDGEGMPLAAGDARRGVPAGVDLAAFRVAQEALTNVVRHAAAERATVRVRRGAGTLEVQVDDDGLGDRAAGGRGPAPAGRTRGIAGMRERALALGGTLEAGPRPGRGFRVRATFPLEEAP